jgi:hypothetical protein
MLDAAPATTATQHKASTANEIFVPLDISGSTEC